MAEAAAQYDIGRNEVAQEGSSSLSPHLHWGEMSGRALWHALHRKALELGAADEGAPGARGEEGFYAAYFRDLDGNKLNFFSYG